MTTETPLDVLRDASPGQRFTIETKSGATYRQAEPVSMVHAGSVLVAAVLPPSDLRLRRLLKVRDLVSVVREVDEPALEAKPLRIKPGTQLARMLLAFVRADEQGLTDDQAGVVAGLRFTGYWKRASDLRRAGLVEWTGQRHRRTRSHVRTSRVTDRGRTLAVECLGWVPGQ